VKIYSPLRAAHAIKNRTAADGVSRPMAEIGSRRQIDPVAYAAALEVLG
jgi:hypothetical protein